MNKTPNQCSAGQPKIPVNHCTGCTDRDSEGTHQGCTIEHGHIGCDHSVHSVKGEEKCDTTRAELIKKATELTLENYGDTFKELAEHDKGEEKCNCQKAGYKDHCFACETTGSCVCGTPPEGSISATPTTEKGWEERLDSFLLEKWTVPEGVTQQTAISQIKSWISQERTQAVREYRDRVNGLMDYVEHTQRCIRSDLHEGRPTKKGGYEQRFGDKWYQSRPVDETPKCDCGLDAVLKEL